MEVCDIILEGTLISPSGKLFIYLFIILLLAFVIKEFYLLLKKQQKEIKTLERQNYTTIHGEVSTYSDGSNAIDNDIFTFFQSDASVSSYKKPYILIDLQTSHTISGVIALRGAQESICNYNIYRLNGI